MMASTRVRLLPVLAVVALGTFAVKAVSIAEAAGAKSAATEKSQSEGHGSEATEGSHETTSPETGAEVSGTRVADDTACPAPDMIAEQAGLSQYEIQVLRSLSERRTKLDTREASMDTREMTISAAENRLNDQISELKRLEGSIETLLASLDDKNDEQLASLVKVYESMKPKDAARIFNSLDDQLMLGLADRMKPASMAAVLADMDGARARTLTQLMAQKTEPPETIDELEARTNGP
jgi:flagellar motility protein MotE (MotC chaperone)